MMKRLTVAVLFLVVRGAGGLTLDAQEANVVPLTLDRMVDLALSSSFQVRQLNLSIDRTRFRLQAERARLRSRVDLNVSAPDFQSISQPRWNSEL